MVMIETCHECGADVDRRKLVRKIRPYGYGTGSNLLLYSSYNSTFWACDATDGGEISMGVYADHYRPKVSDGTTVTEARGSQTWTGASGTFRSSTATDLSSLTNFVFVAWVGAYHNQTVQTISVDIDDDVLGEAAARKGHYPTLGGWVNRPAGMGAPARSRANRQLGEYPSAQRRAPTEIRPTAFAPAFGDRPSTSRMRRGRVTTAASSRAL